MFETGVRQLRMALSMTWGRPFHTDSLTRLVADAVATIDEFGELGLEAREVIETPFADDADRVDHADRSLRRTAISTCGWMRRVTRGSCSNPARGSTRSDRARLTSPLR